MSISKAHILAGLKKEILLLQGHKSQSETNAFDAGLGPIKFAFPNASFPLGAVHEFFCHSAEDASATSGFISCIVSSIVGKSGASVWINASRSIFPPALHSFGITPDKMIFIDVAKEKDRLWTIEEALKCDGLAAVIGEIQDVTFTAGRRLQLAVEKSKVTGFLIRNNPKNIATACETRWRITSLPCENSPGLPGVGFPRWNVELLKVRNGTPGEWQVGWSRNRFNHGYKLAAIENVPQRKAG